MPRNGTPRITLATLAAALAPHGLRPRGGFRVQPADGVPALADGRPAAALVMVGNAGPDMWRAFAAQQEAGADPLDRWSRRVIDAVAAAHGASALYPFDGPPYWPFQRWAQRAEPVHPSPLGPLIHPEYGLWHAYRGALLFADAPVLPAPAGGPSPCDGCADKPCLASCPANAVSAGIYDVGACAGHVRSAAGADCAGEGCRARRACPVGRAYTYAPPQAAFHMAAFLRRVG